MWNSGRLESISATVSPRRTPSLARPPASASTRSRSSDHVRETESSFVRTATLSGWSSTVSRNASAIERAPRERRVTEAVVVATAPATLPDAEAVAREPPDVVGEADEEQREHEREADEARPLHDAEGDRTAAHLLRQGPEDVATVERQEREEVDHAQRQGDHRKEVQALLGAELDALPRDLVGAHHARDLLALLRLEDLGDHRDRPAREEPHLVEAQPRRGNRPDRRALGREQEAEQRALLVGAVDGRGPDGAALVAALDLEHRRARGAASVARGLAGAAVARDLVPERDRVARAPVDREQAIARAQDRRGRGARGHLLDAVGGLGLVRVADRPVEAEQHHERQHDVDRRAGADAHEPLPDGLAVVRARRRLRRDLLLRVHPRDLHEPAERQPADAVLRLPALEAQARAPEEQREALDAHADGLRGGEVAELVEDDERREAGEREQPAHRATASSATSSPAMRRASASAS